MNKLLEKNVTHFANFSLNILLQNNRNCYVENIAEKTLWKIFRGKSFVEISTVKTLRKIFRGENVENINLRFTSWKKLIQSTTTVLRYCWACACYLGLRGE